MNTDGPGLAALIALVAAIQIGTSAIRYTFTRNANKIMDFLGQRKSTRKALEAVRNKDFTGIDGMIGTVTEYAPTGKLDEKGNEVFEQRIRSELHFDLNLSDIFHSSSRSFLAKIFHDAIKHCDRENPLVFSHIEKACSSKKEQTLRFRTYNYLFPERGKNALEKIKAEDAKTFEAVKQVIVSQWIGYYGALYRKQYPNSENLKPLGEREVREEIYKAPILVYELGAVKKQLRVAFIDVKENPESGEFEPWIPNLFMKADGTSKTPDFNRMAYPTFNREAGYKLYDEHAQGIRCKTNAKILEAFQKPGNDWFTYGISVAVPTGKILTVPEPVGPAA